MTFDLDIWQAALTWHSVCQFDGYDHRSKFTVTSWNVAKVVGTTSRDGCLVSAR